MRILVTGPTGFVGSALVARAAADPALQVRIALRRRDERPTARVELASVGELAGDTDWSRAVAGTDAVVHAAARVHVLRESVADPLAEFRRVNVEGTMRLARQAAEAGVRRFVFLSSIKVNGEGTTAGRPYTADDPPAPVDAYGVSKYETEERLRQLASATGMELVIIRPVLVYGPGVKGNFRTLLRWLDRRVPLPFGAVHNQRSFVAVGNLVDLIVVCLSHPAVAGRMLLVSDGEDLSTTELLRRTAAAMGRPARLVPVPEGALRFAARLLGAADVAQRLLGWLQVDIDGTRASLGWSPPIRVDDALRETAAHYLGHARPLGSVAR